MHYLVTGHTGFKGAWLTLLLQELGHEVSGLALDPLPGGIFEKADIAATLTHDLRGDIRSFEVVENALTVTQPDVVVHLAAQPLVIASYEDPVTTMETNVMGTLNVLRAISKSDSVRASLIITTDKVYRNVHRVEGYSEDEPLGGHDPYSASKAMADLLTQSWAKSFPGAPIAVARAGNVIGGGDVSPDRLLPDLITSVRTGEEITIRNPKAVRPWQHVLDCVYGYYLLTLELVNGRGLGEWNFGPGRESFVEVERIVDRTQGFFGIKNDWVKVEAVHHEALLLSLDSTKAADELKWNNTLPYPACLDWTLDWESSVLNNEPALAVTRKQIELFLEHQSRSA